MIIGVLNEKGGVGKTTLVTNLGVAFQRHGQRVLLVDSDPQGSLRDWLAAAGEEPGYPPMIAMDKPAMIKDLRTVGSQYDLVLVDGCPKSIQMMAATISIADIVLIPVQPSGFDLWAANSVVEMIRQRQEIAEGKPKAAFVMSRQITNTKLINEAKTALVDLGLPIFASGTTQKIAYATAASNGRSVIDIEPNGIAAKEIAALIEELERFYK
jgi:chromosome partitioning protein